MTGVQTCALPIYAFVVAAPASAEIEGGGAWAWPEAEAGGGGGQGGPSTVLLASAALDGTARLHELSVGEEEGAAVRRPRSLGVLRCA